jgi:voltage-gated potassium channel
VCPNFCLTPGVHPIPYVLIETNEGLYLQLLHEGVLVIQGDAKRHSVLQEAGIARARGLCIVVDNDADNLYITVTAKALNPALKVITRAGQERYAQAMRTSGADEVVVAVSTPYTVEPANVGILK